MAPNRFLTDLEFTKTQLAVYFVVVLLSVDSLNPVNIVCHVFPGLEPWHMATLAVFLMVYVFLKEIKALLYFSVQTFCHSILSIFFREVEVIGLENIPRYGPVLFSINHANQFVDAMSVLCTCQRKLSLLMAEASYKRRIIGDLAWALDVIPVKRAQDDAKMATGKISMKLVVEQAKVDGEEEFTITGGTEGKYQSYDEGELSSQAGVSKKIIVTGYKTIFTKELRPGDKIRPPGTPTQLKITSIESDTSMTLGGWDLPEDYKLPSDIEPAAFEMLKRVDTKVVFERVLDRLASGGAVGIFPEGGSHDRTELLPLKVGIALIAFSALEHDGINVPIVPVGLNYFRAHRWRGKLVVEYGRPTSVDPADLAEFKAGGNRKRNACNKLLEGIETSMRSVIVSTPDYETLELIHTARRLYQKNTKKGQMELRQDLSRRFAEGYKQLMLRTNGNPPQEWLDLQTRIVAYRNELKDLGLRDYQVPALAGEHIEENISVEKVDGDKVLSVLQYLYQIAHLLFLLTVAAVPVLFLNLPVGIMAGLYAERRRKKALAASKVKVRGYDVMLTEKVLFCIVMVPSLWIFYAILMCTMTDMDGPTIALAIFQMPLFAYMSIVVAEAGMVDWKFIRPVLMRLFPSSRKRLAALPRTRKNLQEDLRAFIKSIGPGLGEIYYKKENLDWKAILKASNKIVASPLAKGEEEKKDR